MRAQLLPLEGGPSVDIVKDLTLVGRREDCDLRLDHKSVSKMHCVIVKTDGLLLVRDLGSTNGTRVNGQRVRRAALLPNDQLTIAAFKYRITFAPDLAPSEAPQVSPHEHTQQLDPDEVARLLAKAGQGLQDSDVEVPVLKVQQNALPDIYDDERKRR